MDDVHKPTILFDMGVLRLAAHRTAVEVHQHYFLCFVPLWHCSLLHQLKELLSKVLGVSSAESMSYRYDLGYTWLVMCMLLASCATHTPIMPAPSTPQTDAVDLRDACSIFRAHPTWYDAAYKSSQVWGVPIHTMMAIIHQESRFRADARPLDEHGRRRSSAYGYPQALDGTWKMYVDQTKNTSHRRDNFHDAVMFIGWYGDTTNRKNNVDKHDTYALYLNYHEGPTNYRNRTHLTKPWLLQVAKKVDVLADTYARQLQTCDLDAPAPVPKEAWYKIIPDIISDQQWYKILPAHSGEKREYPEWF